jgi:ATP-binding cassette subfamily C protein CydC
MTDLVFFFKLFVAQRWWCASGLLLSLLSSFASIALLTLSGWFITSSAIAGLGDALAFNFMLPAAQIRALAITRTLSRYAERLLTHEATFRVLANIRSWFFKSLIPLTPGRLALWRSADLLSRITADIDALDALYLRISAPLFVAFTGMLLITVFLCSYSTVLGASNLVLLLITAVCIPWIFSWLAMDKWQSQLTLASNFRIRQIDILQGLYDLLAYQAYEKSSQLLTECSNRLINNQRSINQLTALSAAFTQFLSQLSWLVILVIAALLFRDKQLSNTDVAIVIFCVLASFELVQTLPTAIQAFTKTQTAAQRIRQISQTAPSILEPQKAIEKPAGFNLQISDVSFSYTTESNWVLNNITLDIPYGDKIGLVGASGIGKSTFLHLLLRYFDPVQGEILLNHQAIKNYQTDDLLACIGFMSQRSQLFAASIKDNLLIAKPDATSAELLVALQESGLADFVQKLPNGLETWIGENGVKISGGEARRLTLARLYLKNAPIWILDEPTEGLDAQTEQEVLTALMRFTKDKTVILSTHKPASLALVDRTYGIQAGCLVKLTTNEVETFCV